MSPYAYVGGYGGTISVLSLDERDGTLALRSKTAAGSAPSYLAVAPDARHLYAINEAEGADSLVLAFEIAADGGALREIDQEPSGGEGAPHLAVHPSGRWLAVAHYLSGHTSILPIERDGTLAPATQIDRGPDGNSRKAHQALFDASGAHLLVPCLKSGYVLQHRFADGKLEPNAEPTVVVSGGPRHLALTPDERHAYALSELSSEITWFDYDASTGQLSRVGVLPGHVEQAGASAHIEVHRSGKFLYASHRDENSVGVFALGARGQPQLRSVVREGIAEPRDFTIDPSGRWLLVANQSGAQDLRVYRIDPADGSLHFAHATPIGGKPSAVRVIQLA